MEGKRVLLEAIQVRKYGFWISCGSYSKMVEWQTIITEKKIDFYMEMLN